MKPVLLVSLNTETLPDPVFPLGLACLAGALHTAGRDYQVYDLAVEPLEGLRSAAMAAGTVALSLRNLDNVAYPHSTSYLPDYGQVFGQLRDLDAPLILGGPGFSLYPEALMTALGADFGIIGGGEGPLVALLAALDQGGSMPDIPGLLHWQAGQVRLAAPPAPGNSPGALPRRQGFPLRAYADLGAMANVQTKRGCPFGCVYCSYPLVEGTRVRLRPVAEVVEELGALAQEGCREVYFVDSVFNHPPAYAKELCAAIHDARLDLRWTCYASPAGMDRELVELFQASGCLGVEFGTDALCATTLVGLGKHFGVAEALEASRLCAVAGLPFCHSILAGGPGETPETLAATIAALDRVPATAVIFMTGIRIIPQTALHQRAIAEGVVAEADPLLEPVFYLAPGMGEAFTTMAPALARNHRNWVLPGHSIRYDHRLAAVLRRSGTRGPLWLHFAR